MTHDQEFFLNNPYSLQLQNKRQSLRHYAFVFKASKRVVCLCGGFALQQTFVCVCGGAAALSFHYKIEPGRQKGFGKIDVACGPIY